MQRISFTYLFNAINNLEEIDKFDLKPTKLSEISVKLFAANSSLAGLYSKDSFYNRYLRASAASANKIFDRIHKILKDNDLNKELDDNEIHQLKNEYSIFKPILLSEIETINLYLVLHKDPFDVFALLSSGEKIFPNSLEEKVPEAVFDVKQAAQCLALELPTACGFHVFRALESVLRKYYEYVTDRKAQPKNRNIAVYINAMNQAQRGNPKVLAALKQISDLYRNPLIHPDATLDVEEAIAIIGIARSVCALMLKEMPEADEKISQQSN